LGVAEGLFGYNPQTRKDSDETWNIAPELLSNVAKTFTRYEAMNGGAKCRKWGGLGWFGGGTQVATIR